jgi:aminoglycoside phosphotransferase (APT) family kinase protein
MSLSSGFQPDLPTLGAYLKAHLAIDTSGLELTPLEGGQSNPTYLVTAADQRFVIRMKPGRAAELLPSAHQIEREFRVLAALAESGIPVPRVHHLCADEAVIGRAFFVMDYVAGRNFRDPRLSSLSAAERSALFDDMNRVLARLHRLDPVALGLEDFGKSGDYLARQIARWSRQYRASETERIESMNRLMDWLPAHLPPDDQVRLVHGDFRLDNLIIHPSEPRVVAVIDWELSTLGSPLADAAYHCCLWHFPSGVFRGFAGLPSLPPGIPEEAAYLARYADRTGRERIEHWDHYLVYNCFRMAAIMQGIAKRAAIGTAVAADAHEFGRGARTLADLAWAKAEAIDRHAS